MNNLGKMFMGSEGGKKRKFEEVSIHDNLLIFPGSVIQISNISKVNAYGYRKTWPHRIIMFLLALGCLTIAVQQGNVGFMYVGALVFGALFVYAMMYRRFGIQIQTNGSTTDFLITKSQDVADNLYSMIAYFINNAGGGKVVTIDNSLNITYGDKIMGDKFSDIENSMVINRSVAA